MSNLDNFLKLVSKDPDSLRQQVAFKRMLEFIIDNRKHFKVSQDIALKILIRLDELNITKQELALYCNVSIDEIMEIVKGQSIDLDKNLLEKICLMLNLDINYGPTTN